MNEDQDFYWFIQKIKEKTGIDLAQYKEAQMRRRLTTLREKRGFGSFQDFFHGMMAKTELFNEFLDRMTINVSEFWRNPNRWEVLVNRFLPELIAANPRLKCWSAACSTGEEPYSLAMILDRMKVLDRSRINASDLDNNALEQARAGKYLERSVRDVPADYVSEYFRQEGAMLHIADKLKQAVHFNKMNLLNDKFEESYDLIICRNVLIYFTEPAKQLLYAKFSKALRPGGLLFVGSTEQIFNAAEHRFESAETFFYRKL